MELKYYLRGLGLGIAITAIIMGITTSKSKAMTNEEIIARAKQLGMTQDTVLTEINSNKEDEGQDADAPEAGNPKSDQGSLDEQKPSGQGTDAVADGLPDEAGTDTGASDSGNGLGNDIQDGTTDTEAGADAGTIDADAREVNADARTTDSGTDAEAGDSGTEIPQESITIPSGPMVITIGSGDGSYSASKKLEDVGAIHSASEFDNFLCQNGYDKKIRTGTYTIPADASEEQMARIITGAE